MTNADKFKLCIEQAKKITAAYRAEAPEGCDPQGSWVAVAGLVATEASADAQGKGLFIHDKADAAKAAANPANAAKGINAGKIPDAALYQPVDFEKEQLDTIHGNWRNLSAANELSSGTNAYVTQQDLARASRLIPNYRQMMKLEGQNATSLLGGHLPYDDVLNVVSNRAGLTNATGIPGTGGQATLRDLGQSQLGAIQAGQGIMQSMVQTANSLSPLNRYMTPQDEFLQPADRIKNAMIQNQTIQESQQNANNLKAGISPTQNLQNQLALLAALGPQPAAPNYAGYAASAAQALGSIYGKYSSSGAGASEGTASPYASTSGIGNLLGSSGYTGSGAGVGSYYPSSSIAA